MKDLKQIGRNTLISRIISYLLNTLVFDIAMMQIVRAIDSCNIERAIKTKATLVHVRHYLVMLSKPLWLRYDTSTCIDRKRSIAWCHKPTSVRLVPALSTLLVLLCIHPSRHLYESIDLLLLTLRYVLCGQVFFSIYCRVLSENAKYLIHQFIFVAIYKTFYEKLDILLPLCELVLHIQSTKEIIYVCNI